jgi:hypothetical protein
MTKQKRYRMELDGPEPCVIPVEDAAGEWVTYEDYRQLFEEKEKLRKIIGDAMWRQMNGETPVLLTGSSVEPRAESQNSRDLQEIRFLEQLVKSEYGDNFRQWYFWDGESTCQRDEADESASLEYPPVNRT